ncbi:DUF5983 family protein [Alteromonas oceanisediminis]|uniref:DUF5983 family protein n=1 Tax=Alteromonas oceanisediminis TaxID=2836180 RepID=UPI001BDB0E22|nr:hypothetical protein [Alteromonas oceanisediminis]MBT0587955.1 hypothetical protein [Alteromonas oceanisediminis]
MGQSRINVLQSSTENYKTVCLSTQSINESDHKQLDILGRDSAEGMIQSRDTGWWVKLYNEPEYNHRDGFSDDFNALLADCLVAGYRMVEFDADCELVI